MILTYMKQSINVAHRDRSNKPNQIMHFTKAILKFKNIKKYLLKKTHSNIRTSGYMNIFLYR